MNHPNALSAVLRTLADIAPGYQQIVGFSDDVIEDLLSRTRATADVVAVFVGAIETVEDGSYEDATDDKLRRFSILFRTRAITDPVVAYSTFDAAAEAFSGTRWTDTLGDTHLFYLEPVTVLHGGQYSGSEINIVSV